jgi:hypothetical protein
MLSLCLTLSRCLLLLGVFKTLVLVTGGRHIPVLPIISLSPSGYPYHNHHHNHHNHSTTQPPDPVRQTPTYHIYSPPTNQPSTRPSVLPSTPHPQPSGSQTHGPLGISKKIRVYGLWFWGAGVKRLEGLLLLAGTHVEMRVLLFLFFLLCLVVLLVMAAGT